jgi:DNA processing protein
MNESLFLAYLGSIVSLTSKRLEYLKTLYEDLREGVKDDFVKVDFKKNSWLEPIKLIQDIGLEVDNFEKKLIRYKVNFITLLDGAFPSRIRDLSDRPVCLFYQGDLNILKKEEWVTVVGSRNYTKYAENALNQILEPICKAKIGIVSGLAHGIDFLAHKLCSLQQSPAVAVIGSGLDDESFYPKENLALKNQIIVQGGLVFSEYPPGFKATQYTFPKRNRLLAALGNFTFVIQASYKSGSLITSTISRDLGKDVATIPVPLFEDAYSGNLKLIKDGCQIITESQDIFGLLNLTYKIKKLDLFEQKPEIEDPLHNQIYEELSLKPKSLETIAENVNIEIKTLVTALTMLELEGFVKNVGQNQWVKCL